jgi:hypothetical protein
VITIREKSLRVDFDPDAWLVLKWDDHDLHRHGIGKLNGTLTDPENGQVVPQGTKAVDIIALDGNALHFIEIKDFRGFAAENAFRQPQELPLEVGLKVRGTLAGLVGAYVMGRQDALIAPFARTLLARRLPLRVIAWVAEDAARTAKERRKNFAVASERRAQLEKRLSWLTHQVWVDDPLGLSVQLPGVHVREDRSP